MTRSLTVAMAMLLLGACASAPVDESAAPFTEGVYRFATSDMVSSQSASVSSQCENGVCMSSSTPVIRRMSGTLVLEEDGSMSLESPYRCGSPSPDSWRDEDVRSVAFNCGSTRVILGSAGGMALYRVERKNTVRGDCAKYSVDMQGRRTNFCEVYRTRTVTSRETVQFDLKVERVR